MILCEHGNIQQSQVNLSKVSPFILKHGKIYRSTSADTDFRPAFIFISCLCDTIGWHKHAKINFRYYSSIENTLGITLHFTDTF